MIFYRTNGTQAVGVGAYDDPSENLPSMVKFSERSAVRDEGRGVEGAAPYNTK